MTKFVVVVAIVAVVAIVTERIIGNEGDISSSFCRKQINYRE
jgi:hypothetical protein